MDEGSDMGLSPGRHEVALSCGDSSRKRESFESLARVCATETLPADMPSFGRKALKFRPFRDSQN
jgi:hypothetical protein